MLHAYTHERFHENLNLCAENWSATTSACERHLIFFSSKIFNFSRHGKIYLKWNIAYVRDHRYDGRMMRSRITNPTVGAITDAKRDRESVKREKVERGERNVEIKLKENEGLGLCRTRSRKRREREGERKRNANLSTRHPLHSLTNTPRHFKHMPCIAYDFPAFS